MPFVCMHKHSHFSLMDAISEPKDIVAKVKSLGQTATALTDHGVTSGLIETYKECKEQGIHFVFGVEHYLVNDVTIKDGNYKHICMWAKNNKGYYNLKKLTSLANDYKYKKPLLDIDIIREHSEGIVISTACIGGWLRSKDDKGNNIVDYSLLEKFIKIFPNDLYVELHTYSIDEQKEWNLKLIEVAKQYNLPLIAACDAHYINKEDAYTHKMWLTQGKEREDGYYQYPEFYIHSEQEVRDALSYLPQDIVDQAIDNTQVLADSCNVEITFGEQHYPTVDIKDKKEAVMNIMRKNWKSKVPDKKDWQAHKERVFHELPVLEKADYFPYFLIMHDILDECRRRNIPISPSSRGSAGGCDVAYLMDIHRTNPLKFDLMFARFLHEERVTPCDIDVDVSKKRRPDVIEIIKDKYGHDRVFQAVTYGYMAARGAFKRAGKSLGYDPQYILELSKGIPKFSDDEEEFKGKEKEWNLLDKIATPEIDDVITLAKSFVGILQNYGVHASAVIVFPDDPNNYTAIRNSKDTLVTEYEFHTLEDIGILKLDILGIKTIDVIDETLKLINEPIDIKNLPSDDNKTFDMLCKSFTAGVFQVEGNGFTQLIKKIQPRHFEDLAPLLAIFRPAIIDAGLLDTYINRKNGTEIVEYLHPDLEPLLCKTLGLAVYQENIIEIAKTICGYTPGQSDLIRRACGRKKPEEMEQIKPDFISKAVSNGYTEEFAIELFALIEYFAGYGFGKAHTYGYGEISYITAYLKANYTKEFMVSLINSEDKQEDILPYIQECKNLGIPILPPDLSKRNEQWVIEGDSIRVGLTYLKGVGKNLSTTNVDTFAEIVSNNSRNVTEALIKSGSLDYLNQPRGLLLANLSPLQDILSRQQQCLEKIQENEQMLSEATTDKDKRKFERQLNSWKLKLSEVQSRKAVADTGGFDEVQGEIEVLSFSFSELPKIKEGVVKKIFQKNDKRGNPMAFITWSTKWGEIKSTVFASDWKKLKTKVVEGKAYKFVNSDTNILKDIKEV